MEGIGLAFFCGRCDTIINGVTSIIACFCEHAVVHPAELPTPLTHPFSLLYCAEVHLQAKTADQKVGQWTS